MRLEERLTRIWRGNDYKNCLCKWFSVKQEWRILATDTINGSNFEPDHTRILLQFWRKMLASTECFNGNAKEMTQISEPTTPPEHSWKETWNLVTYFHGIMVFAIFFYSSPKCCIFLRFSFLNFQSLCILLVFIFYLHGKSY